MITLRFDINQRRLKVDMMPLSQMKDTKLEFKLHQTKDGQLKIKLHDSYTYIELKPLTKQLTLIDCLVWPEKSVSEANWKSDNKPPLLSSF